MNLPVNKKSFIELLQQDLYKQSLVDSMLTGVDDELKSNLKSDLEYVLDNRIEVFSLLSGKIGDDEDELEVLIIPAIRKTWSMVFINKPTLFNFSEYGDKKLELFQLYWDVDDFINYLVDFLPKIKNCLIEFKYLDMGIETLNLVCQNYINKMISNCRNKTDDEIKLEIRDLKLKKTLK
jgi:hypothetical protein